MRRALLLSLVVLAACEDGPEQVFVPNEGNPDQQNGHTGYTPWTPDGDKPYEDVDSGDAAGRAEFCDDDETQTLIQEMVLEPIRPDESLGGIAMWDTVGGGPTA